MSDSFVKNEELHIQPVSIIKEMQRSFLDYSMSVIVSRALPDVRDGLKPVHRRILYTMHILKNTPTGSYKKSARIVGDTMGRFHPHGDSAIYDALVRLSQPFSMRYPLVDGQGNFGSVDGDPAAAMRYTEVRMDRLAMEMLTDIDKETVDFIPNYDDKEMEPSVLPNRIPNLLVNGASGIAVGMATNIPPHNMGEVADALIGLLQNPKIELTELMRHIKGPDFPTGGFIYGRDGIWNAYKTGRGKVLMRARVDVEILPNDREALVVTEIPFQVNKAMLITKIADLVKDKVIEGISDIRDESDKSGMRVVIFLKKEAFSEIVLNRLYKLTQLQSTFGVNMIAIVDGKPQLMDLKSVLVKFLEHRRQIILRRTEYQLNEALKRQEIVEGLGVASLNISEVIELIRKSATPDEAKTKLMAFDFDGYARFLERAGIDPAAQEPKNPYRLSMRQAAAILDMRLHRLTGLQQEKLADEFRELAETITGLRALLDNEGVLIEEMIRELREIKEKYGDERRTEILEASGELSVEDLIEDEAMVLTMTKAGYIKTTPADAYKAQNRGGRGRKGAVLRDDEDMVTQVLAATAHKTILFFTDTGRVFKEKMYALPKGGPNSRGKAIINFLGLQNDERVVTMLSVADMESEDFIFFVTRSGIVKKTAISQFANINANGIIAIKIDEGDHLIAARITDGTRHIFLGTKDGYANRFPEDNVRGSGRNTRGVKGISLRGDDHVVGVSILDPTDENATVLSISELGFGKRSSAQEYTPHRRGSMGVISLQTTERNGSMIACMVVEEGQHLIVLTEQGILIRVAISDLRVQSRNTQGVTIMRLDPEDRIIDVALLAEVEENGPDDDDESDTEETGTLEEPSGFDDASGDAGKGDAAEEVPAPDNPE